jgi:hypothetical protein
MVAVSSSTTASPLGKLLFNLGDLLCTLAEPSEKLDDGPRLYWNAAAASRNWQAAAFRPAHYPKRWVHQCREASEERFLRTTTYSLTPACGGV